ncbi:hypothetical protein [Clostridium sp. MCC353]|uniref:hypothetical protein n=1 Tax=Clostridium sp. MCC353 TaxID=2592646 RepID=UPI00207A93E1|nr:hypothetical protein [Clostridium sp. MCC353]
MRKLSKSLLACACMSAILFTGNAASASAAVSSGGAEQLKIYGPVTQNENNRLTIRRDDQNGYGQELVLNISAQHTRILDAVTGFPVAQDQIRDNELIYAYIGPAVTMSLPPIGNPSMILCNIPADYKVPEYVTIDSITLNADQTAGTLTSGDTVYELPADCTFLPYLTRNYIDIRSLKPGDNCLIWTEPTANRATKLVLFADSSASTAQDQLPPFGWSQEDGNWVYYTKEGARFTGWLNDNGSWYYLDTDGIMCTGFLTIDGKTYYLQENGQMLTTPKTFRPDASGALFPVN